MTRFRRAALPALLVLLGSCASLGQILQPPTFSVSNTQRAELRLAGPSLGSPLGSAVVRLYARVQNPNAFGLTLGRLNGGLMLEGRNAARVDFPMGLPLQAGGEAIVPIEVRVSLSDLPQLADVVSRAIGGGSLNYRLDGSFGVDAGLLGQPTFGPMTLLSGQLDVRR